VIFALHAHRGLLFVQAGEGSTLVVDMRDDCGGRPVYQERASQPAKPVVVYHRRWHSQAATVEVDCGTDHRHRPEVGMGTRVAHRRLYMVGWQTVHLEALGFVGVVVGAQDEAWDMHRRETGCGLHRESARYQAAEAEAKRMKYGSGMGPCMYLVLEMGMVQAAVGVAWRGEILQLVARARCPCYGWRQALYQHTFT